MGSCSSNHKNGGEGFNPGNNGGDGFNPGHNTRPPVHQAGNMAPEQPAAADAAAEPNAPAPTDSLASPQLNSADPLASPMGAPMQPPMQPQAHAAAAAAPAQANPAGNPDGQAWIDFDPRTNKPMLRPGQVGFQENAGTGIPINDADANRQAFEAAAISGLNGQAMSAPMPGHGDAAPLAGTQSYGSPIFIGATSANMVSDGRIVHDGHWKEFEAANNVMTLEEFQGHQL